MIVRLWTTRVDQNRIAEYEENERNRSTPMFRQQPGCLGALFLRSGETCFALTFWKDLDSVEQLKTSHSYLEASAFYSNSGMLLGEPSIDVFDVKGGFLNADAIHVAHNGETCDEASIPEEVDVGLTFHRIVE